MASWTPPSKPLSLNWSHRTPAPAALGWLALVRGVGLLVAGGLLGLTYDHSVTLVIYLILAANVIALAGLFFVLRRLSRRRR